MIHFVNSTLDKYEENANRRHAHDIDHTQGCDDDVGGSTVVSSRQHYDRKSATDTAHSTDSEHQAWTNDVPGGVWRIIIVN